MRVQSQTDSQSEPYAIFENRDFLFYLIGRFVASFGAQMLTVAVGWELYERTHSAMALGLVGLTQFVPMVLMTLPAGHVADSRERKKVILVMQSILIAASLGLALISILQVDVFWIYCCLVASGVARTFLWSASASFMPQLVSREQFPRAITWSTSSFQFSAVTGPAAGGVLIALTHSAATVYMLNTIAATLCFILVYLIRVHRKPLAKQEISLEGLLGGFRFVFQTPIILGTITLDLFAVLFGGATALLPIFAKDILHVGPTGLGFLEAALPIGALSCALYFAHRPPLEKAGRALVCAVIVFGAATIGFGLSKWFWFSMLMLFFCGFADNISVIVRHTLVQVLTPDAMRGRVSAVNNLFIGTSNELGGFESGTVSHVVNKYFAPRFGSNFGPTVSVVSGGILTILVVLIVAKVWPELPRFGQLVPKEEETKETIPTI